MYANILIQYEVKKLNQTFIYHVPSNLEAIIKVGMKVCVPFGKKDIFGFVIDLLNDANSDYNIKDIKTIVDPNLVLSKELMLLGNYLSEITLCTKMTAYQSMLPAALKAKKQKHNYDKYDEYILLVSNDTALEYIEKYPRRTAHKRIIEDLIKKGKENKKVYSSDSVKKLLEEKIIKIEQLTKYRINIDCKTQINKLNESQLNVYNKILNNINTFNTYLLYGVTGSGKTEVYINLINSVINMGKTALVLVPEISLTTQIAKRFYSAFGSKVAILHSALSTGEKYDEYLKINNGLVNVVVGTRSAVFAPLKNLGIIVIDEEDSSSYKQESNPRYHARDMALFRAKYNNIPLVLGSATPSLESKARADKKVYELLRLDKRASVSILPTIHIVDMCDEVKKNNIILSDFLINKIKEKLAKKEQIILLLNRRGFSTFITCSNCGYTYKCPNCDISLTYHKSSNNIICHYCGYLIKYNNKCINCKEDALNYLGIGTEKLESKINEMFPDARVIRMDQDTTRNKGSHEKIINEFKDEKYDILLGTQMISKGLDFPKVTLVGVINADTSLNIPDYRSSEATFSMLHQVAGRAGRSTLPGEVIIQTFNPDNYVINCVKNQNYDAFYNQEMVFRHRLKYPPYYYLVSIKIIGKDYSEVMDLSKKTKWFLDKNLDKKTIVLGPTTASVFKYNNNYRMQIIIKYQFDNKLYAVLKDLDNIFMNKNNVYLEIDFNPLKI